MSKKLDGKYVSDIEKLNSDLEERNFKLQIELDKTKKELLRSKNSEEKLSQLVGLAIEQTENGLLRAKLTKGLSDIAKDIIKKG